MAKAKAAKQAAAETSYPVAEIVAATEKIFGGKYKKALVLAALRFGGTEDGGSITISKAKELVKAFAERKVVS